MKAILLIFLVPLSLLWSGFASAQTPTLPGLSGMNYQAAVRNGNGELLKLQFVSFRFSIIAGSPTSTPVYVEHVTDQTTAQAMFNTVIGKNTSDLGSFNNIDWSQGNLYLKVEVDPQGNANFNDLGTVPFYAVPFAMYAAVAGTALNGGSGGGGTGTPGSGGQTGARGVGITWLGTMTADPGGPSLNYAYYNSADRKSYIYDSTGNWQILTEDGQPGQAGVSVTWLGTFATAPASPTLDQAYYNSTDRASYIYDGTTWQVLAQDGVGWNLSALDFVATGNLSLKTTENGGNTVQSVKKAWLTSGIQGSDPNLDFVGTLDTAMLIFKTGGASSSNERMRINSKNPGIYVNGTVDTATSQGLGILTVYGGNAPLRTNSDPIMLNAINAYAAGSNAAIYGRNYSIGYGVKGVSSAGAGIYGYADNRGSVAVKGEQFSVNGGYGVFGSTISPVSSSGIPGAGVLGWAQHINGVGVEGIGNNIDYRTFTSTPVVGAGVIGGANTLGVYGLGVSSANGVGVAGGANGVLPMLPATGAGVAGTGINIGVAGYARASTPAAPEANRWGGYFEYRSNAAVTGTPLVYGYIAGYTAGSPNVPTGIASNAPKSTIIKDENDNYRLLYCTEAPEILFQDYGTSELKNGTAHIDLESLMTRAICVDEKHPLKVFIQLEGDCNGVYVTNKSAKGFDVKELQHGNANVPFSWQIIASRADEIAADGNPIPYSSQRFASAPGPLKSVYSGDSALIAKDAATAPVKAELKTEEKAIINTAFSNLQFSTAQAEIAASSLPSLDQMVLLLQAHPEWTLKLSGHTDNEGSAAFNQTLSEKRSDAVKQYLVSKGVADARITTVGYGQTKPLTTNNTKEAREKNRRVEMEIFNRKP